MTQQPSQSAQTVASQPDRSVVWVGYATFFLLGWCMLLVPSLIRSIETAFAKTDASIGLAYLLASLAWVTGTISSGVLAGRMPRRLLMGGGQALAAIGLLAMATSGTWDLFIAGYLVYSLGLGIIDSGMNAVFMDLFPGRQAGALNRLHLWVAIGALVGPLTIGLLVGAGVPWQAVVGATGAAGAIAAAALATRRLPPTQHGPGETEAERAGSRSTVPLRRRIPLPVLLLAAAIACYVASEMGVTGWLVRYLDEAPIEIATLALSLFWGGLALGRLLSSLVADRLGAVAFTAAASVACGIAVIAALVVPTLALTLACFALAGLAAGPIYPMIMAIGGSLYPDRTSAVSSALASAAVIGSLVYPPLMGVLSETVGLTLAMLGAALFAFATAGFVMLGARVAHAAPGVTPVGSSASQG